MSSFPLLAAHKKIIRGFIAVTFSGLLAGGSLFAQPPAPPKPAPAVAVLADSDQADSVIAPDVIFSNLVPTPGDRYDSSVGPFPIIGKRGDPTEILEAVAFIPKSHAQVKVLSAAIGYTKGTRRINLGIYSNDDGVPGTPLPGGLVNTESIPDIDQCCQMTTVTLPGEGVTVTAGTGYWLVASPDDVNAPDFVGGWHPTGRAAFQDRVPPGSWEDFASSWPAAQIRGTKLTGSSRTIDDREASGSDVVIYKNLGQPPYRYFNAGVSVNGRMAPFNEEVWEALPFTPKTDTHATTLAAAISWISGTRLVRIGIYSDENDSVGMLLPGGQGSTRDIPDVNECCQMTKVKLAGEGVALKAGTQYWLVVSPDNLRAPDFHGQWDSSSLALASIQEPEEFGNWQNFSGLLLAAEIRGTLDP